MLQLQSCLRSPSFCSWAACLSREVRSVLFCCLSFIMLGLYDNERKRLRTMNHGSLLTKQALAATAAVLARREAEAIAKLDAKTHVSQDTEVKEVADNIVASQVQRNTKKAAKGQGQPVPKAHAQKRVRPPPAVVHAAAKAKSSAQQKSVGGRRMPTGASLAGSSSATSSSSSSSSSTSEDLDSD